MIKVLEVDFNDEKHCQAVVDLMNHYMEDAMGDHPPHNEEMAEKMIEGLRKHCNKLCVLAEMDGQYVGLVNCFISYGTFAAKPFINIHDVVVLNTYRGKGIGKTMLEEIIKKGEEMDCGKLTLEVREDNTGAKHLYESLGFKEGNPPMLFWSKYY